MQVIERLSPGCLLFLRLSLELRLDGLEPNLDPSALLVAQRGELLPLRPAGPKVSRPDTCAGSRRPAATTPVGALTFYAQKGAAEHSFRDLSRMQKCLSDAGLRFSRGEVLLTRAPR